MVIVSACEPQLLMNRKGQTNIPQKFQYTAETVVFTMDIVQHDMEIGYPSLSV